MRRSFVAAAALVFAAAGAATAQPRDLPMAEGRRALTVQGKHFGTLPDDHPVTLRVRVVFEKLVRVAGRRPGLTLEAHALDTPRIILEALRGGIVVISRGAVDLAGGADDAGIPARPRDRASRPGSLQSARVARRAGRHGDPGARRQ